MRARNLKRASPDEDSGLGQRAEVKEEVKRMRAWLGQRTDGKDEEVRMRAGREQSSEGKGEVLRAKVRAG